MSQQIVWDLFTNVLEAAKVLGTDEPEVAAALAKLDPGLRVGRFGQLQEWKQDLDSPTDTHRHVSHLFAFYPGRQIGGDPALVQAARTSLIARGNGEATGWANAWKAAFWARLRDGNQAFAQYRTQLLQNTMPNLWDKVFPSGTFQIDANLGSTAAVAEMLLQSHTGVIDVLPALPGAWSEQGSFDGLRARGAFTVGATWQQGALTEIRLASDRGGPARLSFPGDVRVTGADGNAVDHSREADGTVTFLTEAGASYRIVSANLAVGKSATQSSTYAHPINPIAARAVDGNISGDLAAGSVTHTGLEPQPWWQVDLGTSRPIGEVAVWNRSDYHLARFGGELHPLGYPRPRARNGLSVSASCPTRSKIEK
ncbi:glycoside hydrolase family 95-like protein [Nonomuraea sp. NPDC049152]|uniref:glycosyl hydrolase family 95 catalytic domain-containing protein n=1 Tax=Nonomuraea sp. NPDC049152 TaxID=3154350 RepID=UPI00340D41BE